MKTILVTGGVGFIGTNVCKRFLNEGYHVMAFDNLCRKGVEDNLKYLQQYLSPGKFEFIWGDVRNEEDIKILYEYNIDCAIHLASNPGIPRSLSDPKYDAQVNLMGTINLLEFVRQKKLSGEYSVFLFSSTNKVYSDKINEFYLEEQELRYHRPLSPGDSTIHSGNPEGFPLDGGGEGTTHSPYGCSKAAADLYVQEYFGAYGLPTVVNRMSCIHGLHQQGVEDQGWSNFFVRQIAAGNGQLNIFGNGKQVRDVLDGRDVAELYYQEFVQIDKCKGKVFNVGGGPQNTLSLLEAIAMIEQISGKKATFTFKDWRVGDHRYYVSNISKVKSVLGWEPKIIPEQTLKDMIHEVRKEEVIIC